jgi:site-specific DNA-cytosine methylase
MAFASNAICTVTPTQPAARKVATCRVTDLHDRYPNLFPVSASEHMFRALPQDVTSIDSSALVAAGALNGEQWLILGGWSCEDLSPAGKGAGLTGTRSNNFHDIVRIIGALQQLQPDRPPAFI